MPARKIIFLDVDGSIMTYDGAIPASAKRAIAAARAAGHTVFLCTGRSKAEIPSELAALGFDGMIGANGAYVEYHGEVVAHQTIAPGQCRRLVDWLHQHGLEFYLESNNGLFASEHFREVALPVLLASMGEVPEHQVEDIDVEDILHGMVFGASLYRDDVNKVSYILSSYQDYQNACEAFPDFACSTWGGKGEQPLFGDIGIKGIDKAHAVRLVVDHMGADQVNTIAMGDAKADIPMFEACATSVCMGSGGDEAKAAADYVSTDVDADGLWNAFLHLGLISDAEVAVTL